MTADTIECPFCGETINIQAKKCRFCGEFLEAGLTNQTILETFAQTKMTRLETAVSSPPPATPPPPAATVTTTVQVMPSPDPAMASAPPVAAEIPAPIVVTGTENAPATADDPLTDLYQKLVQMPDSPEKALVLQTLQSLAQETQRGEEADQSQISTMVQSVIKVLPDVAEITINTMINPTSGLLTLVQKVAQHVAGRSDNGKEETAADKPAEVAQNVVETVTQVATSVNGDGLQGSEAPVPVETAVAVEALSEVHEQLEAMPESPEKQLVATALEQLQATKTDNPTESGSQVGELVSNLAEVLPEATEAIAQVVETIAEAKS